MLTIVLVFFVISVQTKAEQINCETIGWMEPLGDYYIFQETCLLNGTTVISKENVELGGIENVNVEAIWFDDNKNIKFLPVGVNKKFPNLEYYSAENAAVEKISPLNFAGLSKLKLLYLNRNKIEIIPEDCFQGLNRLQEINLGNKTGSLTNKSLKSYRFFRSFQQNQDSQRISFCQPPTFRQCQLKQECLHQSGGVHDWK